MTHHPLRFLALLALVSSAAAHPAPARADTHFERLFGVVAKSQDRQYDRFSAPMTYAERQLTLREVSQIIARELPGSILDAELVNQGGRSVYVVRWEPSDDSSRGRIVIFVVDAENGRILSRRGG